jgi:anaerobic glycerol-3-phosphate dehydrogenase
MAWNPKTKIGQVLKTTLQVGGGILGLASGLNVGSAALGAVSRVVTKGTAALSKADGVLSDVSNATDKLATHSKLLQNGVLKKANDAVKAEKAKATAAAVDVAATTDETPKPNAVTDFFKSQNGN